MAFVSLVGIFSKWILTLAGTFLVGSDEGIYAWVAANYAPGTLGGDPHKTIGIIELRGASAQLTFVSDEVLPPELSSNVTFGETTYILYSNSFVDFGQTLPKMLQLLILVLLKDTLATKK